MIFSILGSTGLGVSDTAATFAAALAFLLDVVDFFLEGCFAALRVLGGISARLGGLEKLN